MAEPAIGAGAEVLQLVGRERVADERRHHRDCGIDIGKVGEAGDLLAGQARPALGQIEAAVGGQPGEGDVAEIERGRGAAGADITHRGWVAGRCARGNGGFA